MNSKHVQLGQGRGQGLSSVIHRVIDQMLAEQGSWSDPFHPKLHQARTDQNNRILKTNNPEQGEGIMRREAQASTSVHPAKSPAQALALPVIATVIAGKARLKSHAWTDQEIMKIESEDLARLAYETSETLPTEFQSGGSFLSYWRRERSRHGLSSEPTKETMKQATTKCSEQDQAFKQEWDSSPAVRAEFGDSFSTFVTYKRAEARGVVRITSNRPVNKSVDIRGSFRE